MEWWQAALTLAATVAGLLYSIYLLIGAVLNPIKTDIKEARIQSSKENAEIKEAFSAHRGESKEFRSNVNYKLDKIQDKDSKQDERLAVIEADTAILKNIVLPKDFKKP